MEGEAHGKTFKLKGHTLPGINQRSETKNLADGRSKSSALQMGTAPSMLANRPQGPNPAMAGQPVRQVPTGAPLGTPLNQKDQGKGKAKERFEKKKKIVDPKGYPPEAAKREQEGKMTKEEKAYWDKLSKEK